MITEKFIDIDSQPLFYSVVGTGQPVVLVHGFGEDGLIWQHQVEALQSKYRFIVPDLPGSGRSAISKDMSMEGLAAAVQHIIQDEIPGNEPFIMIGHSMGGYVTLAYAEAYPQRLKALGLFHSTAYADSEEKKATRQKGIEFILQHGGGLFIQQTTPNLFSPASKVEKAYLIGEIIDRYSNFPAESLVQYYKSMIERPDRTAVLQRSTYPVLFIAGEHDTAISLDHIMQQSHLPALSYVHILKRSGHLGMLEEQDLSNQYLDAFLAGVH
jgi:pimeloyl-ACP methyl ester carboxylesterase